MPAPPVVVPGEQQKQQTDNGMRADNKDCVAELVSVVALTYRVMADYPSNDEQLIECLAATLCVFMKVHPWLAEGKDELDAMLRELGCDIQPADETVDGCIHRFTKSMRMTATISCSISQLVAFFIKMVYKIVRETSPPMYNLDRVCDEIWSHGEHLPTTFAELDAMLEATTDFEARPAEVSQFLLKQISAGVVSVSTLCDYPAAKFIWIMATNGRNVMLTETQSTDFNASRNDPVSIARRVISSHITAGLMRCHAIEAAPPYELHEVESISKLHEVLQVSILAKHGAALLAASCSRESDRAMIEERTRQLCVPRSDSLSCNEEPPAKRVCNETVDLNAA